MGKESTCNTGDMGDMGSIPRLGRFSGEGNGNPFQVFLPEKRHGQRSVAGYTPKSHKESGVTERLSIVTNISRGSIFLRAPIIRFSFRRYDTDKLGQQQVLDL